MNSKEVYQEIIGFVQDFEVLGQDWVDNNDFSAAAQARNYAKKLIKDLRIFVEASIVEEQEAVLAAVRAQQAIEDAARLAAQQPQE